MADMITMIVSDGQGNTTGNNKIVTAKDKKGGFYIFYAVKETNDKSVKPVALTMPVGGSQNGLLRLPKLGEKILVAQQGNSYFLMAYLPNDQDMEFREKNNQEKETEDSISSEALTLRYKSPNPFPKDDKGRSKKEFSEIKFSTEETYWPKEKDTIKEGGEHFPKIDRIDVTSAGDVITTAQNYNEVNASRIGLFAGVQEDLTSAKASATKIPEDGTPTNGLEMLPLDVIDEDPKFLNGDIQVRAGRRIILNAQSGITLHCGRSIVTIDDTGISLKSGKISSIYPTLGDSSITISPRTGVSISGEHLSLSANFNYSISDGSDGCISSFAGVTRIKAHDFRVTTTSTASYVINALKGSVQTLEQFSLLAASIAAKRGSKESTHGGLKLGKLICDILNNVPSLIRSIAIADFTKTLKDSYDDRTKLIENDSMGDSVTSMLNIGGILFKVVPIIHAVIDTLVPIKGKENGVYEDSMNAIDSFLQTLFSAILMGKIAFSTLGLHYNSFALKGNGDTDIITEKLASTATIKTTALSPIAGLDFDLDRNKNKLRNTLLMSGGVAALGGGIALGKILGTSPADAETIKDLQEL